MSARIELVPLAGIGEVAAGDDLAGLIASRWTAEDGDVVCISQKVVSKAEGRTVDLDGVEPSAEAKKLGGEIDKDPGIVELVLGESVRIVRAERGVLITETRSGLVCANAGIDGSNVPGERTVTLLPADPDGSARRIRAALQRLSGRRLAVVVADSFGRPWRLGQTDVAIGCAGLEPLADWRGRADSEGQELKATAIAVADQLAAAADLARDKTSRTPVVVVRGLGAEVGAEDGPGAAALRRRGADDLFR